MKKLPVGREWTVYAVIVSGMFGSSHLICTWVDDSVWHVTDVGGSGGKRDFTSNLPTAQLSPALFRAMHWYSPESDDIVFVRTSSGPFCLIRPIDR